MRKKVKMKTIKHKFRNVKIFAFSLGGAILFFLLLYLGIAAFFSKHFFLNSVINGQDFSGKTVAAAEAIIKEELETYKLTICGLNGEKELIKGEDISLAYKENHEIERQLKSQNILLWPKYLFTGNAMNVDIEFSYDKERLKEKIDLLKTITGEQHPAKSAFPKFDGEKFIIEPEVYGTAVDVERLYEKVNSAILKMDFELDLKKEDCFEKPRYISTSEEVKAACDMMNRYISASITYTMNEDVIVDKALISEWITVDDNMNVALNTEKIKNWFTEFGDKYDTTGITRQFTTPIGKAATVTGGTYGWSIDEDTELANLVESIKNGEITKREPAYYIGGTAAVHAMPDWGSTYAEVDLSEQHMWYIVDGAIALETDVVTGEPIPSKITPEGTYSLLRKGLNEVLVGDINPETGEPLYRTRVDYWMQVTYTGVGFHDAVWQSAFGGTLYQIPNIGSHGCVNMPLDKAAALYDMIEAGTPVIFHY